MSQSQSQTSDQDISDALLKNFSTSYVPDELSVAENSTSL